MSVGGAEKLEDLRERKLEDIVTTGLGKGNKGKSGRRANEETPKTGRSL